MGKAITELESWKTQSRNCRVALVNSEDIGLVWDEVTPLIEKALLHAEGELVPEDIKKHLDEGDLRLWVALKGQEILASMVTEIIEYPRKRIVRVITLAGKDMNMWYDFLPMIEGYAVKNGCSSLEAWTRKGMTRKLKDWKHSYDIITKDLKQRMQ
jgi:hypothetical protein|tara:strand:- start:7673 stop:8140 length:468 start_codon:yes stop_codon:yes gene_type:complete